MNVSVYALRSLVVCFGIVQGVALYATSDEHTKGEHKVRIAINGFGRIGKSFLRALLADKQAQEKIEVVAINLGPSDIKLTPHMLKYDSLMGTYQGDVALYGNIMTVDGRDIMLLGECDAAKLPWADLAIDWVVECSGFATKREAAIKHCQAGAKKILISAPAQNEDISIVLGVNDHLYNKEKHAIVSLGSCTTNALLPTIKVLHDTFGVDHGFMSTVHAYTNNQMLLDGDRDERRGRAAALNIVPTTTGAMKVLGKIMPELEGRITGSALRVPVPKVSLLELMITVDKPATVDAVNTALKNAASSHLKGIMEVTDVQLVSSDFAGNNHSVIIDTTLTAVQGQTVKVSGWYDNEWGYSVRLKDFLYRHG